MPLLGKLSYDDGITTIEKNYLIPIDNKFLIWEYNKRTPSALFGYTAFPYGTVIAPDHETWTPTNNPMVNEGYGSNVPIVRIKDTLIIGKGQSLTIKDMTLEMGKDAQIIVESDRAGIVDYKAIRASHRQLLAEILQNATKLCCLWAIMLA